MTFVAIIKLGQTQWHGWGAKQAQPHCRHVVSNYCGREHGPFSLQNIPKYKVQNMQVTNTASQSVSRTPFFRFSPVYGQKWSNIHVKWPSSPHCYFQKCPISSQSFQLLLPPAMHIVPPAAQVSGGANHPGIEQAILENSCVCLDALYWTCFRSENPWHKNAINRECRLATARLFHSLDNLRANAQLFKGTHGLGEPPSNAATRKKYILWPRACELFWT